MTLMILIIAIKTIKQRHHKNFANFGLMSEISRLSQVKVPTVDKICKFPGSAFCPVSRYSGVVGQLRLVLTKIMLITNIPLYQTTGLGEINTHPYRARLSASLLQKSNYLINSFYLSSLCLNFHQVW